MQVSHKNQCLVLRLRNPQTVLSVIPTAKPFPQMGEHYIAVPHGVEETKVLRNMGIDAPAPILSHYAWPGRYKPFDTQREAAAFLSQHNRAFNLSDMGTGKTLAALWAYDYLRKNNLVQRVLIVTPLSTLERTWGDAIFESFPHLEVSVLYGSRQKRIDLLKEDADVYLINHDGVKVSGFVEAMKERKDIDLIIIDEIAQVGRNAGTDRHKTLNEICNKHGVRRKVWGLTGTPTPNAPTDAWGQCRLLVPDRVPAYFNRFKETVMKQVSQWLWVPRHDSLQKVHDAMQPAIRFTRDECIDLPPVMYETRTALLTKGQEKAYKTMLTKLRIEAANGAITAANEAVKAQKLIQIACGSVLTDNGNNAMLDVAPRIDVLMEIIEESKSKTIVFVPFISTVNRVAEEVKKRLKGGVEVIYGDISKKERDRIFLAFQNDATTRVIVAQPATMSHGLNLTAASTIVWFAPITSNETFTQANARITRAGQVHSQLIVTIEGTEIERKYFKRLKERQKVQGVLLDMIKNSRESEVDTV